MDDEHAVGHTLTMHCLLDQGRRVFGRLLRVHFVRHDLARVDIEHEVEEEEHPLDRPRQVGDVPSIALVGTRGAVARHRTGVSCTRAPTMGALVLLAPQAVEARLRGPVASFIGERRHNLRGREACAARFVGHA